MNGKVVVKGGLKEIKQDPYEYILRSCNKRSFESFANGVPLLEMLEQITKLIVEDKSGRGFSKFDASIAQELSWRGVKHFSYDKNRRWAVRLLKYKKEIKELGFDYPKCLFLDPSEYDE